MKTETPALVRDRLRTIQERLQPRVVRSWAIHELDELFRSGVVPDPLPDGFLQGRFITMSLTAGTDALTRRIARAWMPWYGKKFDAAASEGVNVLAPSARGPMKLLWPSYTPARELADRIEAFPFKNRVDTGAVDPDIKVFKIDYDFEANPQLLIRRILDELVQVDDALYLGKILFRRGSGFRPIGFFTLEGQSS